MNAMFTNRVGDFFLTIGFFAIFYAFGTLDYGTVFALSSYINVDIITFIIILLLLGAAAKSAQIGLIKALKNLLLLILNSFLTLKYAGIISNETEKHDINQQGLNIINENNPISNKSKFLLWFIGFSEGDGSFYITGGKSIFSIHLHMSELNLLYEIKNQLNMGVVYLHEKSNSAYFTVKAKKDILLLINIFNGHLFLRKKQVQFEKWVINHSNKYKLNIDIKLNRFTPNLNDDWLAGFIDAEGSFIISVVKRKIRQGFHITQRLVISQKEGELELIYLSKLINGYTEKLKKHDRIVVNYSNSDLLISYLNAHKLRSLKAKAFENWMEIYNFRKSKNQMGSKDFEYIKIKSSLINKLRKVINLNEKFGPEDKFI